ncbi:MAG: peptide chain release factor N(5)-glutamine methyltransferase [Parvularculaceae bacterium]|nr:peptide chain release factor N(5)-glutamine methyltransferase [Parvularculaceae bacterium]
MITADSSLAEALAWARQELSGTDTSTPDLDARLLLQEATGKDRAELIATEFDPIGAATDQLAAFIARRRAGEPVAYILGRQDFWDYTFEVGPGVLIPRPETEMLVEAALASETPPTRVLDLGTGSGCLLLTVLADLPIATGIGIDASDEALAIAGRNREALQLTDRADLQIARFADAAEQLDQGFDLILANPPYIPDATELPKSVAGYEPDMALYSGADGLTAHRECAAIMAQFLTPGGSAFIEIGHDQGTSAEAIYAAAMPNRPVQTRLDAARLPRMVAVGPSRSL